LTQETQEKEQSRPQNPAISFGIIILSSVYIKKLKESVDIEREDRKKFNYYKKIVQESMGIVCARVF
jgi:hypothetical protein